MATCDFKGCTNEATTKGHVYGHIKGSKDKDNMIPIEACDVHKERNDFFEDQSKPARLEHNWEPTDTEGRSMECVQCGVAISFYDGEEWDRIQNEACPGAVTS